MDLSKRQWYVVWFFLSLAVIDEFMGEPGWRQSKYRNGTNLCSFMRVSFLWAPMIVLAHLAVYAGTIIVLTYLPLTYFGFGPWALVVGGIIVGLLAIGAAVALEDALKTWHSDRRYRRQLQHSKELIAAIHNGQQEPEKKGPSFTAVVWGYAVATKRRICPMITFH